MKSFISRPLTKLYFSNGFGLYVLNSYKFNFFPRFYFSVKKDFWEIGFFLFGLIFEIMWNKHFAYKKKK